MLKQWLTFGLSSEEEDRYRKACFGTDLKQARICILLVLLPVIAFSINDYIFLGFSVVFYCLSALRFAVLVGAAALVRWLRSATSYDIYDRAEFNWGILVVAMMLVIAASRPQAFSVHVIVAAVGVFVALFGVPNRFVHQLVLALAITIGESLILAPAVWAMPQASVSVLLGMLLASSVGIAAAHQFQARRRWEFLAREGEQEARAAVEKQLAEFRRTEESLRESELRFRALFESSPEAVFFTSPHGSISAANPAACAMFGWTEQEFRELGPAGVLDLDDQRLLAGLEERRQRGYVKAWELTAVRKNREKFPVEVDSVILPGEPFRSFVIMRDITERKRAEMALRESEERLNHAQKIADVGSWECDFVTDALLWSEQTYRQMGEEPDFKPSRDAFEQRLYPEDRKVFAAAVERAISSRAPFDLEFRIVRCNGETRILHSLGEVVRDRDDRPIRMLGVCIDVTEQKRAEEELRDSREKLGLALRTSGMRLWQLDLRKHKQHFNDKACGDSGIDPFCFTRNAEELFAAVHPDDGHLLQAAICKAIATGVCEVEYRAVWPDGTLHFVAARGQLVRDAARRPQYIYGLLWDITDRKRAEVALQEANVLLEQKVQERTSELAQRADQLRALAGELALSEQHERGRLSKLLHDHLQQLLVGAKFRLVDIGSHADPVVQSTTKRIEQLLDESIQVSRSLTYELSPPILHEGDLKAAMGWLVRWMADKHGLVVELAIEKAIPPVTDTIKILLFDFVRELLFNVVKHARAGSASVSVGHLEEGQLRIIVSDNGSGFDPSKLKVGENGRGFGLFSIGERLNLIGGQMEIASSPGTGSRFLLTVPPSEDIKPERLRFPLGTKQNAVHQVVELAPPQQGAPIRVLLADDHAVVREGLARLLGNEPDIEILGAAANGQEAVEMAAELLPDVILMDISMPKLNGIEATRLIINKRPDIRIIGLSMFQEEETAQAMLDAGAVSYLTKSGPSSELIKAIRKCKG